MKSQNLTLKNQRGLTLVELMVALLIGLVIMMLFSMLMQMQRVEEITQLVTRHHPEADMRGIEPNIPVFP